MGENELIPQFPKSVLDLGLTVPKKEGSEDAKTAGGFPEHISTQRDHMGPSQQNPAFAHALLLLGHLQDHNQEYATDTRAADARAL